MKRSRRKPLSPEEREQVQEFGTVAVGPCAVCGVQDGVIHAHHVVAAQELRRRNLPVYDVRNALPLCSLCHERHENASRRVPFRKLRAANIDYAYEVLGPFAADYIRARYPMQDKTEETKA